MIDFIRQFISGNKKRFIDRQYNLDLTYITPRIIAMSYPSDGFSMIYRNNLHTVERFLRERHGKNYRVINLSGYQYNSSYFNNKVENYYWIDHQVPQLDVLFEICYNIMIFLKENKENIIAVHCNAGKGRTGTVIICFLLYTGVFNDVNSAMKYYSLKRYTKGYAVTQSCQVRYINYFYQLLKGKEYFPNKIKIKEIKLLTIPLKDQKGEISPLIEIYDNKGNLINKTFLNKKVKYSNPNKVKITDDTFEVEVKDDVTIKLYSKSFISQRKLGMICFNTGFIDNNSNKLVFELKDIDPDILQKKNFIYKSYSIILEIEVISSNSNFKKEAFISHKTDEAQRIFNYISLKNTLLINVSSEELLFGDNSPDLSMVLNKEVINVDDDVKDIQIVNDYENECNVF